MFVACKLPTDPPLMNAPPIDSLVPKAGHPFFIVTPPYLRSSASATILHLLCHYLNLAGESAFIVHWPPESGPIRSLPFYAALQTQKEHPGGLLAPLITQDALDFYDRQKLTPIVIYPEVLDNPFQATFFGRFILNYPGKIKSQYKGLENFAIAYSKNAADSYTRNYPQHPPIEDVLFIPTWDLTFWNTHGATMNRQGSCYYAGDRKGLTGKAPENLPDGSVEILRGSAMGCLELRDIFWRSEAFYCFKDTSLAVEARLCGCPTVFVPNEAFRGPSLTTVELGNDGSCVLGEAGGIERATATVARSEHIIRSHMVQVPQRIGALGAKWKAMAGRRPYEGMISYPFEPRMVLFDRTVALPPGHFSDGSSASGAPHGGFLPLSRRLIVDTMRCGGAGRLVMRIVRGLRRYGLVGCLRLLKGLKVTGSEW